MNRSKTISLFMALVIAMMLVFAGCNTKTSTGKGTGRIVDTDVSEIKITETETEPDLTEPDNTAPVPTETIATEPISREPISMEPVQVIDGDTIGILMPTEKLYRWNNDGQLMELELSNLGYSVDLRFADNNIATQVDQLEDMINAGYPVIIIASIDGDSLSSSLKLAKEKGTIIIAYDRLIFNSDAVSYYVTFDNYIIGVRQAEYIIDTLDINNSDGPFNIELFAGDSNDTNAKYFYVGAMDVLKPYIDNGQIVVKSGETEFADVATMYWSTDMAQERMENLIISSYSNGTELDAVLCSNDTTAYGVIAALEDGYTGNWPIITGQDCDLLNIKKIIDGHQSMSILRDPRVLVYATVEMADECMTGSAVTVNDTVTFDNGMMVVPAYCCEAVYVDANNYEALLIDSGYYTADELS